ncbi:aldehyde dehydrogenase (NADP(+)) [Sphingomonas azotifigens]|uniref:aldehyde dehydrogenase (NADP(+)) n=1 Tax=Sphingomonas azotifigens TaxID=330920 RepID=UPI0009FF6038|nr:aldehyde dehydrogenase (NADP(+)) [Sphingomonas azotifigens]
MALTGELFIASKRVARDGGFRAVAAATGSEIEPSFSTATLEDVDAACAAAEAAFLPYSSLSREERAKFLEAIAEEIEALGDELIERAMQESGLPQARLQGERGRTAGQLRLFAKELRLGDYLRVRIDHAIPDRAPLPKPDLRLRMVPLGPVAVFGASNFPLAFSTAGGDTASALAAGCPVVVKGHPAHPGTAELVATAITRAAEKTGMPEGVFSMVAGTANELGSALVSDPRIKAVGFTGSRGGGLALVRIAQSRPVPIPVYAEMSSINPVFLLPAALEARAEALGKGYVASVTMGAGQFCTNPGLVLALEGPALERFLSAASEAMLGAPAQVMLTPNIHKAYESGVAKLSSVPTVEQIAQGVEPQGPTCARGALFTMKGADFIADPSHAEEIFGATSLLVRCASVDELKKVVSLLEGQLTTTLHMDEGDVAVAQELLPSLERLAGRILANGWPTGVEVTDAMVHGGPFPSTSDGRSTSVGTLAIDRYLRPVSYQDLPEALLPADVRDGAGVPARVDGKPTV